MRRTRTFRPRIDALEPRLQLSVAPTPFYPLDFVGPIPAGFERGPVVGQGTPAPIDSPDVYATGITFAWPNNAPNPMLGVNFTANLTLGTSPDSIVSTTWTLQITYQGLSTPLNAINGTSTSAQLVSSVPGTYNVYAYTTYKSMNPSAPPHAPTTVAGVALIPVPTTANKWGGINTPTAFGVSRTLVDTITTSNGTTMGGMGGAMMAQEMVGVITYWNGTTAPGQTAWFPPGPGNLQFQLSAGAIQDQVMPGDANWSGAPITASPPYASYSQQLQITWGMTVVTPTGLVNQTFVAPLNTLNWTVTKVDANDWQIQ